VALEGSFTGGIYLPIRQTDDYASVHLIVRTDLTPGVLASSVRAALEPIEPNLPNREWRTLLDLVDKAVSPRRFVVRLLTGFSGFALILASLGIYGLISYSVTQRKHEIAIRMALGASASDLQTRIVLQTPSDWHRDAHRRRGILAVRTRADGTPVRRDRSRSRHIRRDDAPAWHRRCPSRLRPGTQCITYRSHRGAPRELTAISLASSSRSNRS
jgi:hypothetical protein